MDTDRLQYFAITNEEIKETMVAWFAKVAAGAENTPEAAAAFVIDDIMRREAEAEEEFQAYAKGEELLLDKEKKVK